MHSYIIFSKNYLPELMLLVRCSVKLVIIDAKFKCPLLIQSLNDVKSTLTLLLKNLCFTPQLRPNQSFPPQPITPTSPLHHLLPPPSVKRTPNLTQCPRIPTNPMPRTPTPPRAIKRDRFSFLHDFPDGKLVGGHDGGISYSRVGEEEERSVWMGG